MRIQRHIAILPLNYHAASVILKQVNVGYRCRLKAILLTRTVSV